jgi:general secretion pathway protein J
MDNKRGFTLIELLVAISVLAIVAVLGWRGLDTIVRARVALTSDLEQTRGLQLAFAQMQSDASHIASADSIGNRPLLDAERDRLTLVRTVFADNQPSRLQVVAYRVRDGVLTRRESVATRDLNELDTSWSAAIGDTESTPPVVLQSGVEQMAIRAWDRNGMAWRTGTQGMTNTANVPSSPANPPNPPNPSNPANQSGGDAVTGLEVTLQLRERSASLVKIFLLGAV